MKRRLELSSVRGPVLLAVASFIWGTAFVAQSMGMDRVSPFAFNAARSFVGCAALFPVAAIASRGKPKPEGGMIERNKKRIAAGLVCGTVLACATLLQQTSLVTVSAGKAGFLTALYIVLVPVLGIFLGRRPGILVWVAVAIALAGAWCLSVTEDLSVAPGDMLLILCALFFSVHILSVDRFIYEVDGIKLSCAQFFVTGIISAVCSLIFESSSPGDILSAWAPILYTGVLSSGVAYTLQILGQKNTDPTVASLVMSMESVFAALAGWVVLGDVLSPKELLGCGLVFAAVILAQLPTGKKKDA